MAQNCECEKNKDFYFAKCHGYFFKKDSCCLDLVYRLSLMHKLNALRINGKQTYQSKLFYVEKLKENLNEGMNDTLTEFSDEFNRYLHLPLQMQVDTSFYVVSPMLKDTLHAIRLIVHKNSNFDTSECVYESVLGHDYNAVDTVLLVQNMRYVCVLNGSYYFTNISNLLNKSILDEIEHKIYREEYGFSEMLSIYKSLLELRQIQYKMSVKGKSANVELNMGGEFKIDKSNIGRKILKLVHGGTILDIVE